MAKDPYRYFRIEAQELLEGLCQGFMQLEKGADKELVRRLLRQAHTFKGASRVVKRTDIGDLAHKIEDLLSPHRDDGGPLVGGSIDRALDWLDQIRLLMAGLGLAPDPEQPEGRPPEISDSDRATIRIAVTELDTVLEGVVEAHTAAASLRREGARLASAHARVRATLARLSSDVRTDAATAVELEELAESLTTAERGIIDRADRVLLELTELRAAVSDIRLVPAQTLISDLTRVVRDASRSLDKEVELRASGADTHVDAHVLAGLRQALVHIVRNSVAHGIESRAGRVQAGKPRMGCIEIAIERRGHRVSITCRDDGRGIDLQSVRAVAIERGLVSAEDAQSMDRRLLGELLLRGGLSTSPAVTGISGRGVGLDAVRHAIDALEGEVVLDSMEGEGTTTHMLVPLSLSSMPALSLHVGDHTVLVPLDNVRRALRVGREDVSRDADGERLVIDGQVLPYLPLRRALELPASPARDVDSAVVIESRGRFAAIGVDRLGEARSVVVRGIPQHAAGLEIIAGAAFDDDGVPQLLLAAPALVRAAAATRPHDGESTAPRELPPLLVIDDSLTTRMLEQSILESAGYDVDLAVSGEDGLEKARHRRYGVFIVDVEMPGMDGFEFIATARADPELRAIPALLVTSRADPADKRRGKEVGARAYIVKSEFDQADLLGAIRRLLG